MELNHGYANLVATTGRERAGGGPSSDEELIAGQYRGREQLIPAYERLLAVATALGDEAYQGA